MAVDYEQFLDLVMSRRSIRRFEDRPVPLEQVDRVLDAARWAPSAGNRQGWRFTVVTSRERIDAMATAVREETERLASRARADTARELRSYLENFHHFGSAPVVVAPLYRAGVDLLGAMAPSDSVPLPVTPRATLEAVASISAAVQNLLLAAHTLGLGACWMTGPLVASSALVKALGAAEGWELAGLVALGYPAESPSVPARKPLARIRKVIA